jgi:hypothetical protein
MATANSENSNFVLKKCKKSGNYSIMRKINDTNECEKIKYKIYNCYLPFGAEEYKNNNIINIVIDDSNNLNYNLIFTFNKIINIFQKLNENEINKQRYNIADKVFFPFMKLINNNKLEDTKKYSIRLYIKYGIKITHKKYIGELTMDQLKKKYCNIDIEIGSMWVNEKIKQYGLNIYVNHISVIN